MTETEGRPEETVTKDCEWCGDAFTRPLPTGDDQRFCSRSCASKQQHAERDTPHDPRRVRNNVRGEILNRDGHTCRRCDESASSLEVHHLIPKMAGGTDHPKNLLTLCKRCHRKVHWEMKQIPTEHPDLLEELREVVCEEGEP